MLGGIIPAGIYPPAPQFLQIKNVGQIGGNRHRPAAGANRRPTAQGEIFLQSIVCRGNRFPDTAAASAAADSFWSTLAGGVPHQPYRRLPLFAVVGHTVSTHLLKNRPQIVELAKKIALDLKKYFITIYDDTGAIGKLYRRQDEIGTPFCLTVDVQSQDDQKVTIRDRDTMLQDRIDISNLKKYFEEKLII